MNASKVLKNCRERQHGVERELLCASPDELRGNLETVSVAPGREET